MKADGGPAYPRPYSQHDDRTHNIDSISAQDGMTLRDHYAGLAMMGIIITPDWTNRAGVRPTTDDEIADAALDMAETMIQRRALRGW